MWYSASWFFSGALYISASPEVILFNNSICLLSVFVVNIYSGAQFLQIAILISSSFFAFLSFILPAGIHHGSAFYPLLCE